MARSCENAANTHQSWMMSSMSTKVSEEEWTRVASLLDEEATRTYLGWIQTKAIAKAVGTLTTGLSWAENMWVTFDLGVQCCFFLFWVT